MAPPSRTAMLFIGVCAAVGGALAVVAGGAGVSLASLLGPADGPSQRIALSETFGKPATAPTPTTASLDDKSDLQDGADETTADAEPEKTPEPVLGVRPGSVFGSEGRGSLACRIPGGSDFLVEWDAAKTAAVAHFSGVKIPGALIRERAAASNTLDSRVAISSEEDGHRFSMTIDDSGTMRASVDGQDSSGTCDPA